MGFSGPKGSEVCSMMIECTAVILLKPGARFLDHYQWCTF